MTKRKAKIIKDPKVRGEWAESVFMERAGAYGLAVSRPWGEMHSYDFVVGNTGRFASVQVKSTIQEAEGGYVCTLRTGDRQYAPGSFDFLAAYVVLEDIWYIIPSEMVVGKKSIRLYPKSEDTKYEKYREAWHLLREGTAAGSEQPSADDAAEGETVTQGAVEQPSRLPGNAVERFQSAGNFFRRYMEGKHLRGDKEVEEL
jgi:hypothetical protein